MSKNTFPVNGGAMPSSIFTTANLIRECDGQINRPVLKAMVRREAMRTFGSTAPRFIREAMKLYSSLVLQSQTAWRERHGLAVETSLISAYGRPVDGVRRSAF